jgi:hypothetical protein
MIKVALGDVGEYLSTQLKDSILYTDKKQIARNNEQNFHTSIADCGIDNLVYLLEESSEIFFCPPEKWSDCSEKHSQLYWYNILLPSFVDQKIVHNFSISNQHPLDTKYQSELVDFRKSKDEQIWIVGCSIANSDGVDVEDSYGYLLSKKLQKPASWLTKNSSSIQWQSNQICQSDIKTNDLVFWAVTFSARIDFFYNDKLHHITPKSFNKNIDLKNYFDIHQLDNQNAKYKNVNAIFRAIHFVHKQGAKIFLLDVENSKENSVFLHLKGNEDIISLNYKQIDTGHDGAHPGPRSHRFMYNEFLNMLEKSKQL